MRYRFACGVEKPIGDLQVDKTNLEIVLIKPEIVNYLTKSHLPLKFFDYRKMQPSTPMTYNYV